MRSAIAAEDAVNVAFWQAVLNVGGLIGLAFTVIYAKGAYDSSRMSARADNRALHLTRQSLREQRAEAAEQVTRFEAQMEVGRQQVAIARDTARKQLRPYLHAVGMKCQWMNGLRPVFTVTLNNTGATPALSLRLVGRCMMAANRPPPPFPEFERVSKDIDIGGNTKEEVVMYVENTEDIIRDNISNDTFLYVYGVVRYMDVFGYRYETKFGFFASSPDHAGENLSPVIGIEDAFIQIAAPEERP